MSLIASPGMYSLENMLLSDKVNKKCTMGSTPGPNPYAVSIVLSILTGMTMFCLFNSWFCSLYPELKCIHTHHSVLPMFDQIRSFDLHQYAVRICSFTIQSTCLVVFDALNTFLYGPLCLHDMRIRTYP